MKELPIPTKVRVGDKLYSVEVVEAMREKHLMGSVCYALQHITLAKTSTRTGKQFTPAQRSETFWHELVHAILYEMGHRLYSNEKFVDAFAKRLDKAIRTAEFE